MADSPEIYAFGPYILDVGEHRLCNAGDVVSLAPKAHDLLVELVRRSGTLVTKRELLDSVWCNVVVEEGVLSVYVSALRRCLGDGREPVTYIETDGPPVQLALLHSEAGQLDEAFQHLDAAIASRDPALVHLAVAPQWDWLRADERFDERLRALGLAAAADRARRFQVPGDG